jgi:catechol 2,3-dioxygenase-like lactoylglutathione lyase family enzyme
MSARLDHLLVPAKDAKASAEHLAALLAVPSGPANAGPFHAVYVNDGLTFDFDTAEGAYPVQHYCFRVSDAEFDALLDRLKSRGVPYRSTPHGGLDGKVDTAHGGRIVYWTGPEGHIWEALTLSYARRHA